jgi:hypothetical protein
MKSIKAVIRLELVDFPSATVDSVKRYVIGVCVLHTALAG